MDYGSRDKFMDDVSMNICQSEIAACVPEGEFFVIEAQQG